MKLKVVAEYSNGKPSSLTLTKEKKIMVYGEEFEVSEERAKEILSATFNGKPVAVEVKEKEEDVAVEEKPKKRTRKKEN